MGRFSQNLRCYLGLHLDTSTTRVVGRLCADGLAGNFVGATLGSIAGIITTEGSSPTTPNLISLFAVAARDTVLYWSWIGPTYVAIRLGQAFMTRNRSL